MEHSYLDDIKMIKYYLMDKLSKEYIVSLNDEYINIQKDRSLLLLKLNYLFFNYGEDILVRVYFYTYDMNICLKPNIVYLRDLKLIPFSKDEKFLSLSEFYKHNICHITEKRLQDLYNFIIEIFKQDCGIDSLLYKIPTNINCGY